MKKKKVEAEEIVEEGLPVCEKCGNVMVSEQGEWVCPHCQGEIDFLAEDEDE